MRMLLAVLSLGCLIGCAGNAPTAAQRWMGRNGGCCLAADASRIERLASRFAGVIGRPIRVYVLDREDLRAFGFPGGEIVLTRGLVAALSDNELTAVIGHEVGHLLHHRPAALTGRPAGPDVEAAADAVGVRLLTTLDLPRTAMRSALMKVHASLPATDPARLAIARRIGLLP